MEEAAPDGKAGRGQFTMAMAVRPFLAEVKGLGTAAIHAYRQRHLRESMLVEEEGRGFSGVAVDQTMAPIANRRAAELVEAAPRTWHQQFRHIQMR